MALSAFQIALSNDDGIEALTFDDYETAEGMAPDGYMFFAYNLVGKKFAADIYALLRVSASRVNYFLASDICGNEVKGRE